MGALIVREVVHRTSDIYVPESLGFTWLPGLGYVQSIERVHGRIAKLDDGGTESRRIAQARQKIWDTGVKFGFEHAAQIHPQNPYGKQNYWICEEQDIWLDFLPALRHTGRVWPSPIRYDFHLDAARSFGKFPTFNGINTDRLYEAIDKDGSRFDAVTKTRILDLANYYDKLVANSSSFPISYSHAYNARKPGSVEPALNPETPSKLKSLAYLARLALGAAKKIVQKPVPKILYDSGAQTEAYFTLMSPGIWTRKLLAKTAFSGLSTAAEHGLVEPDAVEKLEGLIRPDRLRKYGILQGWYLLSSRLIDFAALPFYAEAAGSANPGRNLAIVAVTHQISPSVVHGGSTLATGLATRQNLNKMAAFSAIPIVGGYGAVAYQVMREVNANSDAAKHYSRRAIVAKMSNVLPSGGWGSDAEEKLWNFFTSIGQRFKKK